MGAINDGILGIMVTAEMCDELNLHVNGESVGSDDDNSNVQEWWSKGGQKMLPL
jgi:hypothetical protein